MGRGPCAGPAYPEGDTMSFDNRAALAGLRLPPDSTGKALMTSKYWELKYANLTHPEVKVGDYLLGNTSQTEAEIVAIYETGPDSGIFYLHPEDGGTGTGFVAGETLRHTTLPNIASVVSVQDYYAQSFQLIGKNNPLWGQHVDKDGAAYFRFTEGQQQLDAYGLSRMVQPKLLASYNFKYDEEPEDFDKAIVGGASVTYDPVSSGVVLGVGTALGDKAAFTSNVYYPVWPGCGQLITMAMACGDSGKAGVRVRWGYFNKDNGLFYERDGEDLFVVQRSSITGVVVDQRIPQSEWNESSLSAEGEMILDETKINVYWFNLHTLTGGRMRYGVVDQDGFRVTCHNEVDLNESFLPTARNMALPMRIEIENTALTPSPSIVKFHAGTVFAEGPSDALADSAISRFSSGHLQYGNKVLATADEIPVMSFRSGLTFKGVENRLISVPLGYSLFCSHPVRLRLYKNTTLTGAVWEPAGMYTPVEKDEKATALDPMSGRTVYSAIYAAGAFNVALDEQVWSPRGECMTIKGDCAEHGDTYTATLQKLLPSDPDVIVAFAGRWKDIG